MDYTSNRFYRITSSSTSDKSGSRDFAHRYLGYKILFWVTQAVGLTALILLFIWVFAFRGGIAWNTQPKLQFNWHVLTMSLGMIYFCALEIMTFRALRYGKKKYLKLIHWGFNLPILILLIVGYWSILDCHNYQGKANWYSLHSWMGILTTIFYLSQNIIGFSSFLWPGIDMSIRGKYMPFHRFFGLTTFVLGTATALLGMFEEMKHITGYNTFSGEAILMNMCGMLFGVFTILVVFAQTYPNFRRLPLPND